LGIQYYKKLINLLIESKIEPVVVMFEADLPQSLEDNYDGFLSENVVQDFTNYAEVFSINIILF
jgi:beta-glucosidase